MAQQADRESRTEEPIEKKVLDEFEKGNIPVSREASAFAAILASLAITAFMARDFLKSVGFRSSDCPVILVDCSCKTAQMRRHSLRPSFGK